MHTQNRLQTDMNSCCTNVPETQEPLSGNANDKSSVDFAIDFSTGTCGDTVKVVRSLYRLNKVPVAFIDEEGDSNTFFHLLSLPYLTPLQVSPFIERNRST